MRLERGKARGCEVMTQESVGSVCVSLKDVQANSTCFSHADSPPWACLDQPKQRVEAPRASPVVCSSSRVAGSSTARWQMPMFTQIRQILAFTLGSALQTLTFKGKVPSNPLPLPLKLFLCTFLRQRHPITVDY